MLNKNVTSDVKFTYCVTSLGMIKCHASKSLDIIFYWILFRATPCLHPTNCNKRFCPWRHESDAAPNSL